MCVPFTNLPQCDEATVHLFILMIINENLIIDN